MHHYAQQMRSYLKKQVNKKTKKQANKKVVLNRFKRFFLLLFWAFGGRGPLNDPLFPWRVFLGFEQPAALVTLSVK